MGRQGALHWGGVSGLSGEVWVGICRKDSRKVFLSAHQPLGLLAGERCCWVHLSVCALGMECHKCAPGASSTAQVGGLAGAQGSRKGQHPPEVQVSDLQPQQVWEEQTCQDHGSPRVQPTCHAPLGTSPFHPNSCLAASPHWTCPGAAQGLLIGCLWSAVCQGM